MFLFKADITAQVADASLSQDHIVQFEIRSNSSVKYDDTSTLQSCGEVDCKTSVIMVDGKYHMITLDYNVHQGEAANGK